MGWSKIMVLATKVNQLASEQKFSNVQLQLVKQCRKYATIQLVECPTAAI